MTQIIAEYHMLSGEVAKKTQLIPEYMHPSSYQGSFISQTKDKPEGMFKVVKVNELQFILEQIDCDPIHWRGDENNRAKGPDDKCEKSCKYYDDCPMSTHAIVCADTGF